MDHQQSGQDLGSISNTTPIMDNLFAETFINDHVSVACTSSSSLPTLNEAILEPDMFLVSLESN